MATPSSRLFLGLVPWYGLLIVLGAALAVFLADREANRQGLPKDTVIDLSLRILPIGILGARIYYVLFSWDDFASRPISALFIWEGGLAIYGGLIAGFLTVLLFCRRRKLPVFLLLDVLIPGVPLAQAIGRWGNYFNQEAYGLPLPSGSPLCFFPLAVLIQDSTGSGWHLAAFFYESALDLLIFLFLVLGRRRLFRRQGDVLLFYFLLYAAARLVIENVRMDSLYLGSSVRISQLLSVLLCLIVFLLFFRRRLTDGGGLPSVLRAVCFLTLAFTGLIMIFCVNGTFPWNASVLTEILFLTAYSVWMILACMLCYGRTPASEVCYARNKN